MLETERCFFFLLSVDYKQIFLPHSHQTPPHRGNLTENGSKCRKETSQAERDQVLMMSCSSAPRAIQLQLNQSPLHFKDFFKITFTINSQLSLIKYILELIEKSRRYVNQKMVQLHKCPPTGPVIHRIQINSRYVPKGRICSSTLLCSNQDFTTILD